MDGTAAVFAVDREDGLIVVVLVGLALGGRNVGLNVGVFVAATVGLTVRRENVGTRVGKELNGFIDFDGLDLVGDLEGVFVDSGKPEPSSIL